MSTNQENTPVSLKKSGFFHKKMNYANFDERRI